MGLGQIDDVNVVADATAIGGGVVGSVDLHGLLPAQCHHENIGNEMGLDPVILAELSGGSGGVEVAERHEGDAVQFSVPAEDLLEHQLRLPVGIDRFLEEGLVDRHRLGNAECRAG